jgi:hypothetical protein
VVPEISPVCPNMASAGPNTVPPKAGSVEATLNVPVGGGVGAGPVFGGGFVVGVETLLLQPERAEARHKQATPCRTCSTRIFSSFEGGRENTPIGF